MTETIETTVTEKEEMREDLSTREIMEQNWDRFVCDDEVVEKEASSVEEEPVLKEVEAEEGVQMQPVFDAVSFVNQQYDELKSSLAARGISSSEDWIKSLVELERLYSKSPVEVIRQLALNAGFELPKKENVPAILSRYAEQNGIGMQEMIAALQKGGYGQTVTQPQATSRPVLQNETEQSPQLTPAMIQELIRQEMSSFLKQKTEQTKKAKEGAFMPQGVGKKREPSLTHTASGRLKTTREILEEGCQLFGI